MFGQQMITTNDIIASQTYQINNDTDQIFTFIFRIIQKALEFIKFDFEKLNIEEQNNVQQQWIKLLKQAQTMQAIDAQQLIQNINLQQPPNPSQLFKQYIQSLPYEIQQELFSYKIHCNHCNKDKKFICYLNEDNGRLQVCSQCSSSDILIQYPVLLLKQFQTSQKIYQQDPIPMYLYGIMCSKQNILVDFQSKSNAIFVECSHNDQEFYLKQQQVEDYLNQQQNSQLIEMYGKPILIVAFNKQYIPLDLVQNIDNKIKEQIFTEEDLPVKHYQEVQTPMIQKAYEPPQDLTVIDVPQYIIWLFLVVIIFAIIDLGLLIAFGVKKNNNWNVKNLNLQNPIIVGYGNDITKKNKDQYLNKYQNLTQTKQIRNLYAGSQYDIYANNSIITTLQSNDSKFINPVNASTVDCTNQNLFTVDNISIGSLTNLNQIQTKNVTLDVLNSDTAQITDMSSIKQIEKLIVKENLKVTGSATAINATTLNITTGAMDVAVQLTVLNNLETQNYEGYEFNTTTATIGSMNSQNTTLQGDSQVERTLIAGAQNSQLDGLNLIQGGTVANNLITTRNIQNLLMDKQNIQIQNLTSTNDFTTNQDQVIQQLTSNTSQVRDLNSQYVSVTNEVKLDNQFTINNMSSSNIFNVSQQANIGNISSQNQIFSINQTNIIGNQIQFGNRELTINSTNITVRQNIDSNSLTNDNGQISYQTNIVNSSTFQSRDSAQIQKITANTSVNLTQLNTNNLNVTHTTTIEGSAYLDQITDIIRLQVKDSQDNNNIKTVIESDTIKANTVDSQFYCMDRTLTPTESCDTSLQQSP